VTGEKVNEAGGTIRITSEANGGLEGDLGLPCVTQEGHGPGQSEFRLDTLEVEASFLGIATRRTTTREGDNPRGGGFFLAAALFRRGLEAEPASRFDDDDLPVRKGELEETEPTLRAGLFSGPSEGPVSQTT
jgi:hypothetical protein